MPNDTVGQRYLQRHSEPGLADCTYPPGTWQQVLVIPAYRESPSLLQRLTLPATGLQRRLVILVLNRPDSDADPQANSALRAACDKLPAGGPAPGTPALRALAERIDLYVHDLDLLSGPLSASRGVGLARKTGFDLALRWIAQGVIDSPWICSGDADAVLPADYFLRLDSLPAATVAAVFGFRHVPGNDPGCNEATALYELRLHHYVLGLEYAASPYAYHTLGSCLAVRAGHYIRVRGFPKRAGGEDFYLLNKLAKLGPIARLAGACITLESRYSDRAPFGTGPAVAAISRSGRPSELPLFYHTACFEALRCLLLAVPRLRQCDDRGTAEGLQAQLGELGLDASLAATCSDIALAMGLEQALGHCRRQGKSAEQFLRQFHQWFDGFRTLKFIHALRDAGWPLQALANVPALQPQLWPEPNHAPQVERMNLAARTHWGWTG